MRGTTCPRTDAHRLASGNTVLVAGQRTDVLVVTSAQMITADMVPDAPGIWLYHCHISDHMLAGMDARYEVKDR